MGDRNESDENVCDKIEKDSLTVAMSPFQLILVRPHHVEALSLCNWIYAVSLDWLYDCTDYMADCMHIITHNSLNYRAVEILEPYLEFVYFDIKKGWHFYLCGMKGVTHCIRVEITS